MERCEEIERNIEMKTQLLIMSANLGEARDRDVLIQASTGTHLARGFATFPLANISAAGSQLGNDRFTEVYFTTTSGNLYLIYQDKVGRFKNRWLISNARENKGRGRTGELVAYRFTPEEIDAAVLTVGNVLTWGENKEARSMPIVAILAVNASRCYIRPPVDTDLVSDIRAEFLEAVN